MGYTISTHNGSTVSRQHNIRNRNITDKEEHINPDKPHEIWHDENPVDAYQRIFGNALRDYNARQTHPERKIYNYYQHINKSSKQHPVYEIIVAVGNRDHAPNEATSKKILREYAANWRQANPNLELVGCYYHADEQGVPHIHVDYVPVAHGYKKGLHTQTGLVRALGEMGFEKSGRETAQIKWERSENQRLEDICRAHGLDITHPSRKNQQHIDTRTYKAQKKLETLDKQIESRSERARYHEERATRIEERADQLNCSITSYERLKSKYERLRAFGDTYKSRTGQTITELFDQKERERTKAMKKRSPVKSTERDEPER